MRITHVIIGLNVGGAELMLKRLAEGLNGKYNTQQSVISLTSLGAIGQDLKNAGVPVEALGMRSVLSFPIVFMRLRRALKIQDPDIVQTWMYHADFLGGLAAKSVGINKVVWNVRNTYLSGSGKLNFLFRKLCSLLSYIVPKKIVYVSHSARREHSRSGYASDGGVVIGNGFDTNKYLFNKDIRSKYRQELGLNTEDVAVFSVGRCVPAKDHHTFVKAICEAAKNKRTIKGVLIGRDMDLSKYHISDTDKDLFIVLGEREDIAGLLSAADIFCLHSVTEGFPNALGESMSVGLPCIATKAGDAELILADEKYTVNTRDYLAIGRLISELSEFEASNRRRIGMENREKILKTYALDAVLNRYLMIYEDLMNAE